MNTIAQGLQAFEQKDYEQTYEILMPFARSGNPEAQCIIGNLYDLGLGIDQNWEIAADWYGKSMLADDRCRQQPGNDRQHRLWQSSRRQSLSR